MDKKVNFNIEDEPITVEEQSEEMKDLSQEHQAIIEDFNKLSKEYQALAVAFNRLLDEYNQLHIRLLLTNTEEQKQ